MTRKGKEGLRKHLVHFIAHCTDCSWETGDFITGQKAASDHARNKGHKVSAESGYAVEYNGRA